MGNYIYILECADGTWYTGWTTDLERRVQTHNSGKGAKYTRSRRPVRLIYSEEFETAVEAQRREYALKRLTRAQKEALVAKKHEEEEQPAAEEPAKSKIRASKAREAAQSAKSQQADGRTGEEQNQGLKSREAAGDREYEERRAAPV